VVRRGIEVLGGNGTIEDFSVLPRLWRDAIVFESWEGTHNVLCAQVARDLERYGTLDLVLERSRGVDVRVDAALDGLLERIEAFDPLHFRRQLDTLVRAIQGATLARAESPVAELHIRRHLVAGYDPERDPDYPALLDDLLSPVAPALR